MTKRFKIDMPFEDAGAPRRQTQGFSACGIR